MLLKFSLIISMSITSIFKKNKKIAPVAQLDRALGYGPGGSGFKS